MKSLVRVVFSIFIGGVLLSGCVTNIEHIPQIPEIAKSEIFSTSSESLWAVTTRVLAEEESFDVFDKSAGLIVTEYRTIDSNELSLAQISLGAKTYKYSYTISLSELSQEHSQINVNIRLLVSQFGAALTRQEQNKNLENYLRKRLLDRVSIVLSEMGLIPGGASQGSVEHQEPNLNDTDTIGDRSMVEKIRKTVEDFQRSRGLPVTGVLDEQTQRALVEQNTETSPTNSK